jgi:methionine sulfoxide reductase heme-binding subunit
LTDRSPTIPGRPGTPGTTNASRRPGRPFRLRLRGSLVAIALLGLLIVYATNQILPASTDRQAELRFWLAARSTGIVAFLLLTFQVVVGLVLSHPTNRSTWNLSKRIFAWHDHLWVFVMAFLAAHILALVADPKSGVSVVGAFVPGMSQYRSSPVAIGTFALYAFLVTAITARWTSLLPRGAWLALHRLALLIFVMSWMHGILSGTDSSSLAGMYVITGVLVAFAGAYRYWASRKHRPTFATSRLEDAT